jgi:galactonate dehydratase
LSRRELLLALAAVPRMRVVGAELVPVRATERTVWLFVRLRADNGLTGLGEVSDAFGFANTTREQASRMEAEVGAFADLAKQGGAGEIEAYLQRGLARAKAGGLVSATAYSGVEQALWDLVGKSLGVPVHALLGGAARRVLPMYANINRATSPRTPAGFADSARRAVAEGYRAVKAAPWDGFPATTAQAGIECVRAIRDAVGPDIRVMVDCHSFFSVDLAREVARQLEPLGLAWYEEPVAPERTEDTLRIRESIRQEMAGGEMLFGVAGFAPLCRTRAVHVIMPDVKHCGGLLEMTRIAAMATVDGVRVAPHNPAGPVSTAASVHACAGMRNFEILELQWGEVQWRGDLVRPPERVDRGTIAVADRPGIGVELNDTLAAAHRL